MDPYASPRWAPGTGQGDAWWPRSTREWRVPRERGAYRELGGLPDVMPAFPAGRAKGCGPVYPGSCRAQGQWRAEACCLSSQMQLLSACQEEGPIPARAGGSAGLTPLPGSLACTASGPQTSSPLWGGSIQDPYTVLCAAWTWPSGVFEVFGF